MGDKSAVEEHDEYLKTIEKLYGASFRDIFNVVNAPCGEALDQLWREVITSQHPEYGDWEYPGQAYRHLMAEYRELKAFYDAAMEHLTTTTFLMVKSAATEKINDSTY